MIADLKPYPEYKESGLAWLGDLPANWTTTRTKTRFRLSIEKSGKAHGKELLSVYTHIGVRPRKDLEQRGNKASCTDGYWVVRKGDIIINKLLAWMGAVGVSHFDGVTSPAYDILRPTQQLESNYYHHLFRTKLYLGLFKAQSRGIMDMRLRLYFDELGQIPLICPPPAEQAAIVRFLDWANGRLERAIRAKRKVIALLNEQKQAIIHRAVTRGLDPSVPLKSSGIPWLGDIPQHWEVQRLKWVLRLQRGFDLPADRRKTGSVPVYSSGGHIDNHNVALANPPGVVIGRYGSTDAVFFVTEPYWPHNTALFTTTFYDNQARWCFYLLRSIAKGAYAGKSAVPGVDRKDLFDIVVPRPPVEEQRAIAVAIDNQLTELDCSISSITKEIELLREYRTRLVADVVTGKLDVREAAARLPDEAAADTAAELAAETLDGVGNLDDTEAEEI